MVHETEANLVLIKKKKKGRIFSFYSEIYLTTSRPLVFQEQVRILTETLFCPT